MAILLSLNDHTTMRNQKDVNFVGLCPSNSQLCIFVYNFVNCVFDLVVRAGSAACSCRLSCVHTIDFPPDFLPDLCIADFLPENVVYDRNTIHSAAQVCHADPVSGGVHAMQAPANLRTQLGIRRA